MSNEQATAQEIVTEWLGLFDPPPQIDFQQSEFLQQAIAAALAAQSAAPVGEKWTPEKLNAWARNWHWNDCAEDKPVDPSIYFRDGRMLRAFHAALSSAKNQESK